MASPMHKEATTGKGKKLSVAEPTSPKQFIVILIMHLCKKLMLLNVDMTWKVGFYMCSVTVLSLFTDLFRFPESYFSNKKNILNMYFVKWGWAWTVALLSSFIYIVGMLDCSGNKKELAKRHLLRLGFGTMWWYISVSLMDLIEHVTGFCHKGDSLTTKALCKAAGLEWKSWDPSGHSFLLVYCLLVIAEEAKCYTVWERIPEMIEKREKQLGQTISDDNKSNILQHHAMFTPVLRCVVGALTLLSLLWNMMLLATTIYFHNMPSKLIGVCLAALGWLLSYNYWFRCTGALPVYPGFSQIFHLKER